MPWCEPSRPRPDCLTPPKGTCSVARPNSVSLAAAMASCSVLNLKIGAKGPKVSSRAHSMSGLASASTVGSKNWPEPRFGGRWPPVTIRPPLAMASATWRCTFSTAASSISGPWFTPASKPLPTLAVNPLAANFCTNSSYTASCTEKRFVHTQVWPALRYLLAKAPSTALSMSASANTMNGALPPSSSDIFLTVGALWGDGDGAQLGGGGEGDVAHHVAGAQHLADGDGVVAVGAQDIEHACRYAGAQRQFGGGQ